MKIKDTTRQKRDGYIWNILSSLVTAISSILLLMVIKRSIGVDASSDYSVSVAIANVLINIAHLNSIGFQISDIRELYSFNTYLKLRRITVAIMLLVAVIISFIQSKTFIKGVTIFLYCLYRSIYAYVDVYQGRYQQKGRVDIACKLQFYKVLVPDFVLAIIVIVLKDLILAIVIASLSEVILLFFYNKCNLKHFEDFQNVRLKQCLQLFKQCMPLFFSAFTTCYILNSPKYGIDRILNSVDQVYYAILILPATTVHMLASFMYRPMLTEYSSQWEQKRYHYFMKKVLYLCFFMLIITLGVISVGIPIILPLLSRLYGMKELKNFGFEFAILLCAGGLNALNTFLGFIITIIREQFHMFWIYGTTFFISLFLPDFLIRADGIKGAASSFLFLMLIQTALIVMVFFTCTLKQMKD